MALMKIQGKQVPVSQPLRNQYNYKDPALLIYASGRCEFRILAVRLASITSLRDPIAVNAVHQAAEQVIKPETWSQEDAQRVLAAVGWAPPPRYLDVTRIEGKGLVTFRVPSAKGADTQEVKYSRKNPRAKLNLKSLLREESITVPRDMYQVVPVALGEDDSGLVLFANLRKGELHSISELAKEDEALPSSESARQSRGKNGKQSDVEPNEVESDLEE